MANGESRSVPILTAALVVVGLMAAGGLGYGAMSQRHNKELEKRVQTLEARLAEIDGGGSKRAKGPPLAATPVAPQPKPAATTRRKPKPATAPATAPVAPADK